jgi:putative acetyltransferase
MSLLISLESPGSPDAIQLINELEAHLESFGYPAESRHGYSVDKLIKQGVAFFIMRDAGEVVGCGGIKLYDDYGELKRMYVRPEQQRKGYAQAMLEHLMNYAKQHGVAMLRLETGIHQIPAIKLYEKVGFHRCGPFGEYRDDPVSVYMEMTLS